jgi:hypothetical protein
MARFVLLVNYDNGDAEEPTLSWDPAYIKAHLAYYDALIAELTESGELVGHEALAWPRTSKVVRSDGSSAPLVTDGPFAETKEQVAGFQIVDVASVERAIEIAARISAVPGPGGVPLRQPIEVRPVIEDEGLGVNR